MLAIAELLQKLLTAAPMEVFGHSSSKMPSDPAPTKAVDHVSNEMTLATATLKCHQSGAWLLQKMSIAAPMKCPWPQQL